MPLIYVDIDETICKASPDMDYSKADPMASRISKINKLYDEGNTIVYWTARGSVTKIDWKKTTEDQFKKWGVKYHELKFDKPPYDLYIDDKSVNSEIFFK